MIRVAAIGECMLELTHRDEQTLALGYGGDTLNTALYLARTYKNGVARPVFVVDRTKTHL